MAPIGFILEPTTGPMNTTHLVSNARVPLLIELSLIYIVGRWVNLEWRMAFERQIHVLAWERYPKIAHKLNFMISLSLCSITLGLRIAWPRVTIKHVVILKNNNLSVSVAMRFLWNTMHLFHFTKSEGALPGLLISDD